MPNQRAQFYKDLLGAGHGKGQGKQSQRHGIDLSKLSTIKEVGLSEISDDHDEGQDKDEDLAAAMEGTEFRNCFVFCWKLQFVAVA